MPARSKEVQLGDAKMHAVRFLVPSYSISPTLLVHLTDPRSWTCCPGPPGREGTRCHLIEDGGVASCRGDPHLLEESLTDRILVVWILIRAAEDNPEKRRGRD